MSTIVKLTPADVKLKPRIDPEATPVRYGRRRRIERLLRGYDVIGPDGSHLGIVEERMETFERRPHKGATWVTARWQSPRWFAFVGADNILQRRGGSHEQRGWALEGLLNQIHRNAREAAGEEVRW